jgi:uncharacterized metal-binding protein YceD (DUF177 family)
MNTSGKPVAPVLLSAPPFSHKVSVASVPRTGQHIVLNAPPEICEKIARELDLPSLARLEARFLIVPSRSGIYAVTGVVKASLEQRCIVSLDAFPMEIDEKVDLRFAESDKLDRPVKTEVERSLDDVDPPEPIFDGVLDFGALAVESVALELDPFPRKPGVEMLVQPESERPQSPFAVLAALKKPPSP